jgi:hypothetical protein
MSFTPDEQEKTVKIPIQVRAGQIQFYFDGPLPVLKEGIIGDLVLPYIAVLDPKARKLFSEERKIPLFKKGTMLYVQLRPEDADAKRFANHLRRPFAKGIRFYVELDHETPVAQIIGFFQTAPGIVALILSASWILKSPASLQTNDYIAECQNVRGRSHPLGTTKSPGDLTPSQTLPRSKLLVAAA